MESVCAAVVARVLRVSVPAAGSAVMVTAAKALAGVSLGSEKPKSAARSEERRVGKECSALVVPDGAKITLVTSMVIVLGDWSRFTQPLRVPPLSCTWKVKEA